MLGPRESFGANAGNCATESSPWPQEARALRPTTLPRLASQHTFSFLQPGAPFGQKGLANGQLAGFIGSAKRLPLGDGHRFEQGPINRASALNQRSCQPLETSQGIGGLPIREAPYWPGPRQAKPQTDGPAMDDALAQIGPAQGFQHSGAGPGPAMDELDRPDPAELDLGLGAIEPPGQGG